MAEKQRPNIVFLIGDQWRASVTGYCGNQVIKTPCIDSLAADGAGFTKCFVQNTVSVPSRVAFASGRYCHVQGHRSMQYQLRMHEANMLRTFKENGYHVWWGGKNDMINNQTQDVSCSVRQKEINDPRNKDYKGPWKYGDRLYYSFLWGEAPDYYTSGDDSVIEKAVEVIENPPDAPLFMLVNQGAPHPPYAVPQPWYAMYDRSKVPFPLRQEVPFEGKPGTLKAISERMELDKLTDDDWRELVAVYYGMCSRLDNNIGKVVAALKANGMYENSVIVISSDHGDYTGDYLSTEKVQNCFEDALSNVPLAIKAPGCKSLGAPTDALCQWIDLMPTVFEFAGIEPVATHFGKSLAPILRGETDCIRDYVFCEGGALVEEEHTHERNKSREQLYWPRLSVQQEMRELHGKAVMVRDREYKYVRRFYESDELYDLTNDPHELVNRIDDSSLASVVRRMERVMLDWFLHTGDAVPWRWDLRHDGEVHVGWSAGQRPYGTE